MAELVACDSAAADRLFEAAVSDREISVQFRDDTLVALLKAPSAPEFLAPHEAHLIANNRALLRRVIHLLRVACVKTADWLAGLGAKGSIYDVPDGPAWLPCCESSTTTYPIVRLATLTAVRSHLLAAAVSRSVRGQ
jgi:hypothetical protein